MCVVALSFFGLVAYLQFISARVDPSRMGALQGALGACVLFGFILGNTLFTILSIRLGEFDHLVFGMNLVKKGSHRGIGLSFVFRIIKTWLIVYYYYLRFEYCKS